MRYFCLFAILLLFIKTAVSAQEISGTITDSITGQTIPFAAVYIPELHTGTTVNENGFFAISSSFSGTLTLQITCIGYNEMRLSTTAPFKEPMHIRLSRGNQHLHELVVSASGKGFPQQNVSAIAQRSLEQLKQNNPVQFAQALSNIPGVENNSTGSGIGKPVIRGLAGSRVLVYAQEVRVENQQWGDEHGLGMGDAGIEKVEIIKGPSSLWYGPDAIGGVLFLVDERYALQQSIASGYQVSFNSGSMGLQHQGTFKIHKDQLKLNVFASHSSQADYRQGGGNTAFNTRFSEQFAKGCLGYNYKKWIGNVRYSYLSNTFGLSDSLEPLMTSSRKKQLPYQYIFHHLLTSDNYIYLGNTKLSAILGLNSNNRSEFESSQDTASLQMILQTFTYQLRSSTRLWKDKLIMDAGIQGLQQMNKNKAQEQLIPDAHTADLGSYLTMHMNAGSHFSIEAGLRVDQRKLSAEAIQKENIKIEGLKKVYPNLNYALGMIGRFNKMTARLNLSTGFRAPNTAELMSFGRHEGVYRFEIGNPDLQREKASQADLSLNYEEEHFSFYVNPYYNYIQHYIQLSPAGFLLEDAPLYTYQQSSAIFKGGEAGMHLHPHPLDWLHIEGNYSFVRAVDDNGKSIPSIPPAKMQLLLKAEFRKSKRIVPESFFVESIFRTAQHKIARYEFPSPSYQLFNAGICYSFKHKRAEWQWNAGVNNILDKKYTDHLSRLKLLGIMNPGRSFFISCRWNMLSGC